MRTSFQLLALGALVLTSFWIVRPFLIASAWASMIAVATWPLLLRVEAWLGGRRSLAVVAMTVALLVLLVVPFYFGVTTIVEHAGRIADWSKSVASWAVAGPPAWLEALPLIGGPLASQWRRFAASPQEVAAAVEPFVHGLVLWFGSQAGSVGLLLLQLALTVVVVALLYANGETAARGLDRFAARLAGSQGRQALQLAARAVRAVALGVVVTAIVQSGLVGIGLAIAGVPYVTILTALVFVLAIAQLGPVLVLVPTVVWVYQTYGAVWGTVFAGWAVVCSVLDNLLRPLLIKRGADLPLLLIFAGVVGGLIGFGVIGLFVGPVVLAVAYMLVVDWVADGERSADAVAGEGG